MNLQAPKPEAGSDSSQALRQHTREIASSVRQITSALNAVPRTMPEELGAKGDGVTDDSEAFAATLAESGKLELTRGKTYVIKDVAVPIGAVIDLNGATIKPAAGARSCFVRVGPGFGLTIKNGTLTDPTGICRTTTTLTSGAVAGATTLLVGDATGFAPFDPIYIVCDPTDPFGKFRLHHTYVTAVAGNMITIKDGLVWDAAAGKNVMTSRGLIHIDGPNEYRIENLTFDFVQLGIVLQGQNLGALSSGRAVLGGFSFKTFSLGAIYVGTGVRIVSYTDIIAYGNSPDTWRSGHGWKIDSRDFNPAFGGDVGSHKLTRCEFLNVQDGIWTSFGQFIFLHTAVADATHRYGHRFDHGSVILAVDIWSTFGETPISLAGGSQMSANTIRSRDNGPRNLGYVIEAEDAVGAGFASIAYVNKATWYGNQTIRNAAGWSDQNIRYCIGQNLQEPGAPSLPSLAFRDAQTTGWYGIGTSEWRFAAAGVNTVNLNENGLRTLSGSAALPAFGFVGDDDTGMYRPAANQVAMSAGGVQNVVMTATGMSFAVPFAAPPITFAALPASSFSGATYRVTDRNQRLATWDGTNWRFQDGTIAT